MSQNEKHFTNQYICVSSCRTSTAHDECIELILFHWHLPRITHIFLLNDITYYYNIIKPKPIIILLFYKSKMAGRCPSVRRKDHKIYFVRVPLIIQLSKTATFASP